MAVPLRGECGVSVVARWSPVVAFDAVPAALGADVVLDVVARVAGEAGELRLWGLVCEALDDAVERSHPCRAFRVGR